ncbi:DUF2029 domain-containing protein, partial [Rhodobacteraceae bacterium R_SAG10]|nr:DUF2029 domain-containing protein [Rhodobacteraceae bacterium R_SAG10]
MFAGPGLDADTYRVLEVAELIQQTGTYEMSRVPGYPLYEYLLALVYDPGTYGFTNGVSAAATAVSAVFLALILRRLAVPMAIWIAFAFTMVPVVYANSVVTMDYMVALALVLASTYFVLTGKAVAGGILLGLATGVRLTSVVMLLPLAVLMYDTAFNATYFRRLTIFGLSCVGVAAMCFLPVYLRYGIEFLTFHDNIAYPSQKRLIYLGLTKVWGSFSIFGWILTILGGLAVIVTGRIKDTTRRNTILILASSLVIILYGGLFLRLP